MITYKIYCITNMITHEHYSYHISNCCRGTRKTCGGYHWEYLDEKGGGN